MNSTEGKYIYKVASTEEHNEVIGFEGYYSFSETYQPFCQFPHENILVKVGKEEVILLRAAK